MVLKTKLSLGLGFLFFIIFALAGFCSYYVGTLADEAGNILKDNYDSIVYARNMLAALEDMKTATGNAVMTPGTATAGPAYRQQLFDSARNVFETNLRAEKGNITEVHEKEYAEKLSSDYESFLKLSLQVVKGAEGPVYLNDLLPASERLKQSINGIYDVNMQAVVRKTQITRKDSVRFKTSMSVIGTLCVLVGLAYFWYFPAYISTTCGYLSNRMKNLLNDIGIGADEYVNDEAFVLLRGLDALESKLVVRDGDKNGPQ